VVSLSDDLERVLAVTNGEVVQVGEVCTLVRHPGLELLDGRIPDRDVLRCMDWFDLVLPRDDSQREVVVGEFFEFLHDAYESVIEPERNLLNIETLLSLVVAAMPTSRLPVIDFGCGSGLSAKVGRKRGVDLVGFDICSGMRNLAEERGLTTIASDTLSALPEESLRGSFASYVLHLHARPELLPKIWRSTERGGIFAANFHKGIGFQEFEMYAEEIGMSPTLIEDPSQTGAHGLYVVCTKDS
jgi:SAM-dependent methyltransferase